MAYGEHLLSFWESEIWTCARQRVPKWQSPIKTLDTESLISFPSRQHLMCCHNSLLQELHIPVWLHWASTLGSLCLVSSGLHPMYLSSMLILLFILLLSQIITTTICWVHESSFQITKPESGLENLWSTPWQMYIHIIHIIWASWGQAA